MCMCTCRHGPVELCEVVSGPHCEYGNLTQVTIEELLILHGENISVRFYNYNIKHNYSGYIIIHTPITACLLSIAIV